MTDVEPPCRNTVNKSLLSLLLFIIIILQAIAPKKQKIHAQGMTAFYHLFVTLNYILNFFKSQLIPSHLIGVALGSLSIMAGVQKRWRGVNISQEAAVETNI